MAAINLPSDLLDWFRNGFAECNNRLARKISLVPNSSEPSLDMTFIEHFSQYGAPVRFRSGWIVQVDTHFLGGLRHFHGQWEIADIGLLIHYRRSGALVQSKAAVLQSKRLYPQGISVREDIREDYEIGFARLADPEDVRLPLHSACSYRFDADSRYSALRAHDRQYKDIQSYLRESKVPVFYQFYGPVALPIELSFPFPAEGVALATTEFGTRIVSASAVIKLLKPKPQNYAPSVKDLRALNVQAAEFGWRLEEFVAAHLLPCKEGYVYTDVRDEQVFRLFNRRAGPIAAAVAFSIEDSHEASAQGAKTKIRATGIRRKIDLGE
jgi:hypothetical protein